MLVQIKHVSNSLEATTELAVQSRLTVAFILFIYLFSFFLFLSFRILEMRNRRIARVFLEARVFLAVRAILRIWTENITSAQISRNTLAFIRFSTLIIWLWHNSVVIGWWQANLSLFFPCTAKQIYKWASFVFFSFIL